MFLKYKKTLLFTILVTIIFFAPRAHAFTLTPANTDLQNLGINPLNTQTLNASQMQALLQSQLAGQGSADSISLESLQQLQQLQSKAGQNLSPQLLLGQGLSALNPHTQKITTENLHAQLKNKTPEQIMQMLEAGELGQNSSIRSMANMPNLVQQMQEMGYGADTSFAPFSSAPLFANQTNNTANSINNTDNANKADSQTQEQVNTNQADNATQIHKNPYTFGSIVPGMPSLFNPSMTLNTPPLPQIHRIRQTQNALTNQKHAQNNAQNLAHNLAHNQAERDSQQISLTQQTNPALERDTFNSFEVIPNTLIPDNAPLLANSRLVASNSTQAPYYLNAGKNRDTAQEKQKSKQESQKNTLSEQDSDPIFIEGYTPNKNDSPTNSNSATPQTSSRPTHTNTTNLTPENPPLTGRRAPHKAEENIGIPVIIHESANPPQNPLNLTSIIPPETTKPSTSPATSPSITPNNTPNTKPDTNPTTNSTQAVQPDLVELDALKLDGIKLDGINAQKRTQIQEAKSLENVLDNLNMNDLGVRAKSGDLVAQYKLGIQYYLGNKVDKDIKTAFYWIEKAADKGYPPAMVQLGRFYESGEFGNANLKKAGLWYKKAAEVENADGLYNLARFYDQGIIGKGEEARRLAMGYYRKASNMGHPEALYHLAKFYNTKDDATRDMGQAVQLYRNSAHLGFAPAQLEVGILYELGNFLPKDDANAAAWYTKAALQGLDTAQYLLAGMYLEGRGVPKDIEKAILLYEAAANQNLVDAQFDLGILYITSEAPYFNQKKAEQWFQKASDNGDMNAFDILQNIQNKKLRR